MVELPDGTKVHFGQAGANDFIKFSTSKKYGPKEAAFRRTLYLYRHGAIFKEDNDKNSLGLPSPDKSFREYWEDPLTAGFWSRWLLWEEPTLDKAIKALKKNFGIKVVVK